MAEIKKSRRSLAMSGPAWHEGESLELTDSSADTVSEALVATMSRVMSAATALDDGGDETGNAAVGMSPMVLPELRMRLEDTPCRPPPVPSVLPRGRQTSMPMEYERGAVEAAA